MYLHERKRDQGIARRVNWNSLDVSFIGIAFGIVVENSTDMALI